MRTRSLWIWWMATASAVALAGIVLLVVLDGSDDASRPPAPAPAEPVAAEEPTPPPEPAPPAPVTGTVSSISLEDLSVTGSGLRPDGSGADAQVPVDEPAVDADVAAVTAWLDAHLTAAHRGEGGLLPPGFDGPVEAVTTGLAHPERAATGVRYEVTVGVRGVPEWVAVEVVVDRDDASTGAATFVFTVAGEEVTVVAAQPGEGTAPPAEEAGGGSAEAAQTEGTA